MFERVAARELERVECELRGAAVGLLDLNGFKEINDTLGHYDGDELLIEIARRLREVLGPKGMWPGSAGEECALRCSTWTTTTSVRRPRERRAGGSG